ncbi:hypothetical protein DYU05_10055 [Mucilaginibacter terrenus]|uniref:Uncharacterized protein n=2 Tax=Mucilaginibacter terrenus TaxID=2482727 RepID=A0A3E2NY10_9SPHI|nr:hypothetical protein DYU05_10055 [Mucilaginibacter terrenus]
MVLSACDEKFDCTKWANGYKNKVQFAIIYKSAFRNGPLIYLYGNDLHTNEPIEVYEGSGQLSQIYMQFKPGDTIIKKVGQYNTIIKRKNTTISLPVTCFDQKEQAEKVYYDQP